MFNPPMAESTQKYLSVHNFKVLLQDVVNVYFPTGYLVAQGGKGVDGGFGDSASYNVQCH